MMFMNRWDIEEAKEQWGDHPVLSKATRLLYDLMTLTNRVSDGWHYWPKPGRAAQRLQILIEQGVAHQYDRTRPDVTESDLQRACTPIKALLTREAKTFAGRTLRFPKTPD
jgi:hypothetical protein